MGYIKHHALVVVGFNLVSGNAAHAEARRLEKKHCGQHQLVSALCRGINGYTSFAILPDGSKEGWAHSDDGDLVRDGMIEWLLEHQDANEPILCSWAEVVIGEDACEAFVSRHAWDELEQEAAP